MIGALSTRKRKPIDEVTWQRPGRGVRARQGSPVRAARRR
jgi:hypothetical protein